MPPCLPNCFCNECLPQRLRTLEASTVAEQRAFWERASRGAAGAPARPPPNQLSPRHSQPLPSSTNGQPQRRSQSPPPPPPSRTSLPENPPAPPVDVAALLLSGGEGLQLSAAAIRRDNLFNIPSRVSNYVNNLQDAFSIIQNRLESTGPRRRQSMLEAMQQVVEIYNDMIQSPQDNRPPPPPTNIDHLPTHIFNSSISSDTDRKECTICQEDFQDGEELIVLPCSHIFHNLDECFKGWAQAGNKVCVNCRLKFARD